jgi:hypothetical protein
MSARPHVIVGPVDSARVTLTASGDNDRFVEVREHASRADPLGQTARTVLLKPGESMEMDTWERGFRVGAGHPVEIVAGHALMFLEHLKRSVEAGSMPYLDKAIELIKEAS